MQFSRYFRFVRPFWFLNIACVALAVTSTTVSAQTVFERIFNAEACTDELSVRLNQAKDYIVEKSDTLADDFAVNARDGQQRRTSRQIQRKAEKLGFICKVSSDCTTHSAVQGVVAFGNRIRICSFVLGHADFCTLVGFVTHEFGHNVHVPRDRMGMHNQNSHAHPDRVYQFGYFGEDMCKEDYLPFDIDDTGDPVRRTPTEPTDGILLYPHSNFGGRPRQFLSTQTNDTLSIGYRYFPNLAYVGRNDAFSSARVLSGYWELCDRIDHRGPCIYLDRNVSNFETLRFNDLASSIRYMGPTRPTTGIFLYRDANYSGGGKYFERGAVRQPGNSPTGGRTNQLDSEFHLGRVLSIQVLRGTYEGCDIEGWCYFLRGNVPDFRRLGAGDRLKFFYPLQSTSGALIAYRDSNLGGAHQIHYGQREYSSITKNFASLRAVQGTWEVCSGTRFSGTCRRVTGDIMNVNALGLGGPIRSARRAGGTLGQTTLFQGANFDGYNIAISGKVPNLNTVGFDNVARTVRVTDDRLYILCEDANYRGFCRYVYRGNASSSRVLEGLVGAISSVNVADHTIMRQSKLILIDGNTKGERHFKSGVRNLASVGIQGRATDAYIKEGAWEFCAEPNYRRCRRVLRTGNVNFASIGLSPGPFSMRLLENVNATAPGGDLPLLSEIGPPDTCANYLQGRVAIDYSGNKRWSDAMLNRLCRGAQTSQQPGICFNMVMHGNVNWGGGTSWIPANVIDLCEGSLNANATVDCFRREVGRAGGWRQAVRRCETR